MTHMVPILTGEDCGCSSDLHVTWKRAFSVNWDVGGYLWPCLQPNSMTSLLRALCCAHQSLCQCLKHLTWHRTPTFKYLKWALGVHATLVILGWPISDAQLRCSVQPGFLDERIMREWWGCSVSPSQRGSTSLQKKCPQNLCWGAEQDSFPHCGLQPSRHTETKCPFPTWDAVGGRPEMMSFNGFYLEQIFVFKLHPPLKIKGNSFLKVLGLLHSTKFP